jgi:nitrate reductase gamma subunit
MHTNLFADAAANTTDATDILPIVISAIGLIATLITLGFTIYKATSLHSLMERSDDIKRLAAELRTQRTPDTDGKPGTTPTTDERTVFVAYRKNLANATMLAQIGWWKLALFAGGMVIIPVVSLLIVAGITDDLLDWGFVYFGAFFVAIVIGLIWLWAKRRSDVKDVTAADGGLLPNVAAEFQAFSGDDPQTPQGDGGGPAGTVTGTQATD